MLPFCTASLTEGYMPGGRANEKTSTSRAVVAMPRVGHSSGCTVDAKTEVTACECLHYFEGIQ